MMIHTHVIASIAFAFLENGCRAGRARTRGARLGRLVVTLDLCVLVVKGIERQVGALEILPQDDAGSRPGDYAQKRCPHQGP